MVTESRFQSRASNDSFESLIDYRFILVKQPSYWSVRLRRTALFACSERSPQTVFAHPGDDPPGDRCLIAWRTTLTGRVLTLPLTQALHIVGIEDLVIDQNEGTERDGCICRIVNGGVKTGHGAEQKSATAAPV